jgi:hypothetical protein
VIFVGLARQSALEVTHASAEVPADLGQPLGAEDEQDDESQQQKLSRSYPS